MKILSMTATFGKLDHEELTLQPGLNVIEAPNEWGKSTWCAFIVAMLYGVSTSSRNKKDFLADKERYAPWSGKPMAGRMDICWQGKYITIERSSKGRIPFGSFRAYETETNVAVESLTADNCAQVLLGVEREVFTRSGFLKGSDLPVVEGEALRRRLNGLVTTGDESGASDKLEQKLKELRNSCRFNRTGLIPQAEAQRDALQSKLEQLQQLKTQSAQLQQQEEQQAEYAKQLKNHQAALVYEKFLQTQAHVERANQALACAEAEYKASEEACRELPTQQTAENELHRLGQVQSQWAQLQEQEKNLPPMSQKPEPPAPFAGKQPYQMGQQAEKDRQAYIKLSKPAKPALLLGILALVAAVAMVFVNWIISLPCVALGAFLLVLFLKNKKDQAKKRQSIADIYGNNDPDSWVALAQDYTERWSSYRLNQLHFEEQQKAFSERKESLYQTMQLLTGGKPLAESLAYWQQVLQQRQVYKDALRGYEQAKAYAQTVSALSQPAPKPDQPDTLTLSQEQTQQALQQLDWEQKQLQQHMGQCRGQMEALGDQTALEQELSRVLERLQKLEDTYAAVTLALETLQQASTELQRRFAPRISARTRELFAKLTDHRYDRLLLASDLSMEVAATDEDTPHGVLWRSDGTVDQLYLALRLAVAEELTPDAPLVLDDAFVRFDDKRVEAAMEILKEYASDKQVIIFTCQTREKQFS